MFCENKLGIIHVYEYEKLNTIEINKKPRYVNV